MYLQNKNLLVAIFVTACFFIAGCNKSPTGNREKEPPPEIPVVDTLLSSTRDFKGINWADERDNFADDWLILSGLKVTDDEDEMISKTKTVISFLKGIGVNTVRLPINPPTVFQNIWPRYSSVITKLSSEGIKVILAYWEAASSKDGRVDNNTIFGSMWDQVVTRFRNNPNVFFEIMNEPHGYNTDELKGLYLGWMDKYKLPNRRIVLDGSGYAEDVNNIGEDIRFDSCLLSFHYYTWFNNDLKTVKDWEQPVLSLKFPERTIVTEFGVPMTTGKDYKSTSGNDVEIAYLQGMTNQLHDRNVGSIYWPGIRKGDSYSLFSFSGGQLIVNNASGLDRLKYGWRIE